MVQQIDASQLNIDQERGGELTKSTIMIQRMYQLILQHQTRADKKK